MKTGEQPLPDDLVKAIEETQRISFWGQLSEQSRQALLTAVQRSQELQEQVNNFKQVYLQDTNNKLRLEQQLLDKDALIEKLVEALNPFGSGIDPIPWGKIKAACSTGLAKDITRFNVKADEALSLAHAQGFGKKG